MAIGDLAWTHTPVGTPRAVRETPDTPGYCTFWLQDGTLTDVRVMTCGENDPPVLYIDGANYQPIVMLSRDQAALLLPLLQRFIAGDPLDSGPGGD